MPLPLTVSDFQLRQATCELRYSDAFLIFDRTGDVYHDLAHKFTNLHHESATPAQTQMAADEGTVVLELNALRLTSDQPDSRLEDFAAHFKTLSDSAANKLDLSVFTRVGLRQIFMKSYDTSEAPRAALNSLQLLRMGTEKRFGVGPEVAELLLRWETRERGTILRLKAQDSILQAKIPPDFGMERSIKKELHHFVIDIDYYTLALVEREQWDAVTWITQSCRIVRKELDRILSI